MRLLVLLLLLSGCASPQPTAYHISQTIGDPILTMQTVAKAQNGQCTSLDSLSAKLSPPEIMGHAYVCAQAENYEAAAELVTLAGAFVNFDKRRVIETSTHGAGWVMNRQLALMLPEQKRARLQSYLEARYAERKTFESKMCRILTAHGVPQHDPTYMRGHVPMGPLSALVQDFNAPLAWNETKRTFMHCKV